MLADWFLWRELTPELHGSKALYPLELTIEIRIIAKANPKSDLQCTGVCVDKKLRCRSNAQFIQVSCHGATRSSFEEAAQGRMIHVKAIRELVK